MLRNISRVLSISVILVIITLLLACQGQSELEQAYQLGHNLFSQGRYEEAIEQFDRVIAAAQPSSQWMQKARLMKGNAHLQLSEYGEAIDNWFGVVENSEWARSTEGPPGLPSPTQVKEYEKDPVWQALVQLGKYAPEGVNTFRYLSKPSSQGGLDFFSELGPKTESTFYSEIPKKIDVGSQVLLDNALLPDSLSGFAQWLATPISQPASPSIESPWLPFRPEDFPRFCEKPVVTVQSVVIPAPCQPFDQCVAELLQETYLKNGDSGAVVGGPLSWALWVGGVEMDKVADLMIEPGASAVSSELIFKTKSFYRFFGKQEFSLVGKVETDPKGTALLANGELVGRVCNKLSADSAINPWDYLSMEGGERIYCSIPNATKAPLFVYFIRAAGKTTGGYFVEAQYGFYLKWVEENGEVVEDYPALQRSWHLYWLSIVGDSRALVRAPTSEWTTFRGNPQHSGVNAAEKILSLSSKWLEPIPPLPLELLWTYQTGGQVRSSPAVAGGKVYIGSDDGKLYALDSETGSEVWSYQTGGQVRSSPAVAGGKVYIGSDDGKVYALDSEAGSEVWSYQTGGWVRSSPAVAGGKVYIGSDDGKVYALDSEAGSEVWSYQTGGQVRSSPAVAGGKVYIGSCDDYLYALNAETGSEIWRFNAVGRVRSSPAVVEGVVYFGSDYPGFWAVSSEDGSRVWGGSTARKVWSSPAVVDYKIHVGSDDYIVYALRDDDGAWKWKYKTGGYVSSSPAWVDWRVYIGSDDSEVYELSAKSGELLWSYQTGGPILSSPAVAEGKLYIGSDDGKVYAFGRVGALVTLLP